MERTCKYNRRGRITIEDGLCMKSSNYIERFRYGTYA